jgi:hypothetical protein
VYVKPTTPRSIGGIVDDGIRLYRDAFSQSLPLALCGQICLFIPSSIIQYNFRGALAVGNPQVALAVFKSPLFWLPYTIGLIVFFGFYNALIVQLDGIAGSQPVPRGRAAAAGFRLLPRTILLFIVIWAGFVAASVAVMVLGGVLAGILTAFIGKTAAPLIIGVLMVVLAAIALYAWGRVFLSHIALLVENAGVFKSVKSSWVIIEGHWWRSATVYTIAFIILLIFYLLVAAVNGSMAGLSLRTPFSIGSVIAQLVSFVGGTVLMTFVPAVLLALYHDLKLRKEGTDLAGRVSALAPQ